MGAVRPIPACPIDSFICTPDILGRSLLEDVDDGVLGAHGCMGVHNGEVVTCTQYIIVQWLKHDCLASLCSALCKQWFVKNAFVYIHLWN